MRQGRVETFNRVLVGKACSRFPQGHSTTPKRHGHEGNSRARLQFQDAGFRALDGKWSRYALKLIPEWIRIKAGFVNVGLAGWGLSKWGM